MDTNINFIWIGTELTDIGLLSLKSFHKLGYKCTLWCYDNIINIPDFVIIKDANKIVSLQKGREQNVSDYIRYKLLYKYGGLYSDLDNIIINKLPIKKYILSGLDGYTNCHLLKTPKQSIILKDIIKDIEKNMVFNVLNEFSGKYLYEKVLQHSLIQYCIPSNQTNFFTDIRKLSLDIIEWDKINCYNIHLFESQHRLSMKNSETYKQNLTNLKTFLS